MPAIPTPVTPLTAVAGKAMAVRIDAMRCPICGTTNACAMELERETGLAQPPCWCMSATFTESLRAQVPKPLRGRACICAGCAASAEAAAPPATPGAPDA